MSAPDPLRKFKEPKYDLDSINRAVQNMEDHNHDEPSSSEKWLSAFDSIQENFSIAFGKAVELIERNDKTPL